MQFQDNYLLKNVTTLSIGGPAKKFVTVKTQEELIEAIKFATDQNIPYLVIGGGSNLLVADEGIDCLVIKNEVSEISHPVTRLGYAQGVTLKVKSGTLLQDLVDYTIQHGLSGLQKLSGIPGTVGGAVYGNAGAYGQLISDYLTEIIAFDGKNIVTLPKDQADFNYRTSIFKKNKFIILEAHFKLESADLKTLKKEAQEIFNKRLIKYPPGIKCPGSFFKNLLADTLPQDLLNQIPSEKIIFGKLPAAALLEIVGARGQKLDGIEISPIHANLFINKGSGSAQAFYNLAKKYAQKVKEKFGITLEPEVQLINLPNLSQALGN